MKNWIKILGVLFVLGVVGIFATYKFVYNKPHPKYDELEADFKIRASQLYNDFVADPVASPQKYNGKMLEIQGILTEIESADSSTIAYFVLEEGMFGHQGVRIAMLPEYADKITADLKDKELKIKGLCAGFNDTDVILEHGSLVGGQ